jgi:hypothetical protein
LRRLADQSHDRRSRDRNDLGRRQLWHGAGVWRFTDGGKTRDLAKLSAGQMDQWTTRDPELAAMIGWQDRPAPFEDALHPVWALHHTNGRLYAGTKPAQLFVSEYGGLTWAKNATLADFHDRKDWNPGASGLTLRTLVSDPENPAKLCLAISAARAPGRTTPRVCARPSASPSRSTRTTPRRSESCR